MKLFALHLAVLLSFLSAAVAQTPATLSGRVVDPSGAPIPNADVAVEQGSAVVAHTTTDANGIFSISAREGDYQLSATAQGFRAIHKQTVHLPGATLTLEVGSGGGVQVQPEATPVPSQSSTASTTLLTHPSPTAILNHTPWNYGLLTQGGIGVTEERNSFGFLMAGAHAGKILTDPIGHGPLRGAFEYAVEAFPFWQSYTPTLQRNQCVSLSPGSATPTSIRCSAPYSVGGTFTGASITPIILRWNFIGTRNVSLWVQGAGGVLWTNHKYPAFGGPPVIGGTINNGDLAGILQNNGPNADASVWNFTPQGGVGMHYFFRPHGSIDFGANAVHISSASLGDRNPGVNASLQFNLGTTWWK